MSDDSAVSIDAWCDRELIWENGDSVRYLIVELKAGGVRARINGPLSRHNIAILIDASSSMAGVALDRCKNVASLLIRHLSEDDRLSIVSFTSDTAIHLGSCLLYTSPSPRD